MALQHSFENGFGVFPEAYVKIQNFFGDKTQLSINVFIWSSMEARSTNKDVIESQTYSVPFDPSSGANMITLYNYLKTLPEFTGALDV
jgi:hypothetical protein